MGNLSLERYGEPSQSCDFRTLFPFQVRGGDAGGLAAGVASRAAGTSIATVTTSLAAVELCDEDVAMRCSAQSDAGSAADPEWEAVLAQLLAEEAEEEDLCCRFERRGDDSDDGWDNYSEEEEDVAVQDQHRG